MADKPRSIRQSKKKRELFCDAIRRAVRAQLEMWDALNDAEGVVDGEIDSEQLGELSGELGEPGEALKLDDGTIVDWWFAGCG